jgi:predicted AlkP superfamily phosphohydrolase/phosphomutase
MAGMEMRWWARVFLFSLILLIAGRAIIYGSEQVTESGINLKLYWFIPDGMRAEPDLFNIYKWAEEGKLPNIKKMMDQGAYGYATPVFPSHTPVNFATLLTGQRPQKHFIADGPMHIEGKPLDRIAVGGFSSAAKKSEPIWVTLEKAGKNVILLSIPGSTPPELEKGVTIRGRWGGWGADFHPINFEEKGNNSTQYAQGRNARLFGAGPPLTKYVPLKVAGKDWANVPNSFSPPLAAVFSHNGSTIYAYIYDSTDDHKVNYDGILFSYDQKKHAADLRKGEWSEWLPISLSWEVGGETLEVKTFFKIKVIKVDDHGFFRVRFLYDNLNEHLVQPSYLSANLHDHVGPMVDFVDNFPPQLIHYPEDKITFIEEMNMSFDWHTAAVKYLLNEIKPDIFIGDIYSPNQMLTSRWWMGQIDPSSNRPGNLSGEEKEILWNEILEMYKKLDRVIGVLLDNADENTYVALSSDHGACPWNKSVRLNNLFAKKGWLKFTLHGETGEPIIDWNKSKVIYLKMDNIYVAPSGLSGNWRRASGEAYEKLREEVIQVLTNLKDPETGISPVAKIVKAEDAGRHLDLPKERVGDLVIANVCGYGWEEEMTDNQEIFSIPLESGYKQAIFPPDEKCLWTPFMILGPGVKKNHRIKTPLKMEDQYPTLMYLLGNRSGINVDGKIIDEIFQ